jgi:hypothetical protein
VTRPAALGKGGGGGGATAGLPAGSEDPELCTAVLRPSPKFVLGFLPRIRADNINVEANPIFDTNQGMAWVGRPIYNYFELCELFYFSHEHAF